jgi:transposase-like protein
MLDLSEATASSAPSAPPTDARAARLAKFKREQVIVDYLNRGVSVAEIAAHVGLSEKRLRAVIREILARRMPAPPEEFVAIQVSRLNEALMVAYSAMTDMNLKAVDRVVRIVRELDRYHGFSSARRLPEPGRRDPPLEGTAAFCAALVCRAELGVQNLESLDFAPGIAGAPEAAHSLATVLEQDTTFAAQPNGRFDEGPEFSTAPDARASVASGWRLQPSDVNATIVRAADLDPRVRGDDMKPMGSAFATSVDRPGRDGRPENLPQDPENIESAPGIATASDGSDGDPAGNEACAFAGTDAGQDPPALAAALVSHTDASLDVVARSPQGDVSSQGSIERPEIPLQIFANMESAPETIRPNEAPALGGAPVDPPLPSPAGFRLVKLRMTQNGVMAC